MKKLSKDQKVKFFITEIRRIQKDLSLLTWDIGIDESELLDSDCAETQWFNSLNNDGSNRVAIILYNKTWIEKDVSYEDITKVAFHELLEIMLSKLRNFSENNELYISKREVDEEIHSIIRTLENLYL